VTGRRENIGNWKRWRTRSGRIFCGGEVFWWKREVGQVEQEEEAELEGAEEVED